MAGKKIPSVVLRSYLLENVTAISNWHGSAIKSHVWDGSRQDRFSSYHFSRVAFLRPIRVWHPECARCPPRTYLLMYRDLLFKSKITTMTLNTWSRTSTRATRIVFFDDFLGTMYALKFLSNGDISDYKATNSPFVH